MKKYYFIAFALFAILFISCKPTYTNISDEVRMVKEKSLFSTKIGMDVRGTYGWKPVIPVKYDVVEIYNNMFKACSDNGFVIYLRDGTAFNLNGEYTKFTYYDSYQDTYYNDICAMGEYAMLRSPSQEIAIFLVDRLIGGGYIDFLTIGPYEKLFPGSGGFIYKDPETGKWGAYACDWRTNTKLIYEHPHFERYNMVVPAEYDEVIEVRNTKIKDRIVSLWFARKGNEWYAYNIDGYEIKTDYNLLQQVLDMPVLASLKKSPWSYSQRVGIENASIAFLSCKYNY